MDAFRLILASADLASLSDFAPGGQKPKVLRAALRLARSNGLYYTLLNSLTRSGIEVPSREIARWQSVRRARSEFQHTIGFLNQVTERFGVEYTLIKDCSTVDHVPRDVDVLVKVEERSEFINALLESGLTMLHDSSAETSLQGNGLMRIDVYARIRYLGRDFLDVPYLWGTRRAATTCGMDHPGLSPEAAFLLNSVHGLFGHRRMTLLDFLDMMNLEARIAEFSRCRLQAQACGWGSTFDLWMVLYRKLQHAVRESSKAVKFPYRFGTRFVLRCLSNLDPPKMGTWSSAAFGISLAWDDLVFLIERSGLGETLKHSVLATRLGNAVGHRIRAARGDRKGLITQSSPRDTRRDSG